MPRKQKTIHYIYKTTCLVTNRYYIGMHSTCNLEDGYMGSGKRLRYSIRKHGEENHVKEILEFFETRELLIEAEKRAITPDMVTDVNCMNLKGGGTGGFSNEEHRRKFFENSTTDASHEKIRWLYSNDPSWVNAWGESIKIGLKKVKHNHNTFEGKSHSNKTKRKISESKIGKGVGVENSQYGSCWITKDGVNKKIKKENINQYLVDGWVKGRKT
jgi:hypothetical protein